MNIYKAMKRDRKYQKRRYGQTVDGKSVFLLREEQKKRKDKIKEARMRKEQALEELTS